MPRKTRQNELGPSMLRRDRLRRARSRARGPRTLYSFREQSVSAGVGLAQRWGLSPKSLVMVMMLMAVAVVVATQK